MVCPPSLLGFPDQSNIHLTGREEGIGKREEGTGKREEGRGNRQEGTGNRCQTPGRGILDALNLHP
jgi:hypothetical protein